MITLKNNELMATIAEKGAELQSLSLNGLEYLWQANPAYWPKHSPVLFPVVGELKDGYYIYNNHQYKLGRHGFAREMNFESEQITESKAVFTLSANDATLAVYPFQFLFNIEYALNNSVLSCTYTVTNNGSGVMVFSHSGQPAFKVPLQNGLQYNDYFLEFNNDSVLERFLLRKGLTGNETEKIHLNNNRLQLTQSLFYADAIVMKHLKSSQIKLFSPRDEHGFTFSFNNFPYFGIWAAVDAPFVCLEPWCGIADNIHHNHQLIKKEGINKLEPNGNWQRTWSVELF